MYASNHMLVNKLPAIMAEQDVSIRQLSRDTGITYTTIRAVYHGERRSIQLEVLEEICRVLAVQPGDIYQLDVGKETKPARSLATTTSAEKTGLVVNKESNRMPATGDWRQW